MRAGMRAGMRPGAWGWRRTALILATLIIGIVLTEAAIAGKHIGRALGDRLVEALPHDVAGALIDDRAPWRIALSRGAAFRDAESECRCRGKRGAKCPSND